jgi:hypothetical protein
MLGVRFWLENAIEFQVSWEYLVLLCLAYLN